MDDGPRAVQAPACGLWRVARGDEPLRVPAPGKALGGGGVNRFDPYTVDCGVLYFGTDLLTCFGEVLRGFGRACRSCRSWPKSGENSALWTSDQSPPTGVNGEVRSTSDFQSRLSSWTQNQLSPISFYEGNSRSASRRLDSTISMWRPCEARTGE